MHMPVNRKYEVGKVYSINVSELKPNPEQPRKYFDEDEIKALAADIEKNGLLQNITFTYHGGRLIIISGERRVRAHKHLGKESVEGKYIEGDLLTLALMENILRSDLTAVEFAESVAALQRQKSCSNDEIAQLIGTAYLRIFTSSVLLPRTRSNWRICFFKDLYFAYADDFVIGLNGYFAALTHLLSPAVKQIRSNATRSSHQRDRLTWGHADLYQANFFADRPTATGRYICYLHHCACFSTSSRHSSSTSSLVRGVSGRNGGYSNSVCVMLNISFLE